MIKDLENNLTKYFSYFTVFYIIFTAVFQEQVQGLKFLALG